MQVAPHISSCSQLRNKYTEPKLISRAIAPKISKFPNPQTCAAPQKARPLRTRLNAAVEAPQAPQKAAGFPRGRQWAIHKFGGTCVSSADRIRDVAKLMMESQESECRCVVVSAMGSHPDSPVKVTDLLIRMVAKAAAQDDQFLLDLTSLQEKHTETARQLLGDTKECTAFINNLLDDISNLKAMLRAIQIAGLATQSFTDFVIGHGELWCAKLMAATCRVAGANAMFMDTRDVMVVTPTSDGQSVDVEYSISNDNLDKWARENGSPEIIIATGFIARSLQGSATTLRRNGSDYSATIMGALFQAGNIDIWTDVDGVYSADPRKVPEAVCLDSLTYHEAWELSYFGANVLHPRTTLPAMKYGIPIRIKNFFRQSESGTLISESREDCKSGSVKGIAVIDNISLINVEGTGMVGVPGTASGIFTAIRDENINVVMISQASSEHSVCFAVKSTDGKRASSVLKEQFSSMLAKGRISTVDLLENCCVLAAVGEKMNSNKGVAATMFSSLAKANINIKAIAQGCSEYNITVLIDQADAVRALRCVHGVFYLSGVPLGIGLVGPGLIGSTLLAQFKEQCRKLKTELNIDLRVLGISGSKQMLLSETGVDLDSWEREYNDKGEPADLDKFGDHIAASFIPNSVIIDCTASDTPAAKYQSWMKQGIHIVTPNKKLGAGPLAQYATVRELQRQSFIHFFYEATVGAGLPIIATLKHLRETGDKVILIEGIFSGTLSYIFNNFSADKPFSQIVEEAKAAGFTEPDPREDLAGMDVARKVTILARECGLPLELDSIPIESLVPEPLQEVQAVDEFMTKLPGYDSSMAQQVAQAEAEGEVLRYVGQVDVSNGKGSVQLKRYPKDHPFGQLNGSDNIILFTTERYFRQPLIVRGPGAGAEVTAGGVFSDLLRLAAYLGAPS